MGMTIHYNFRAPSVKTFEDACRVIGQLRDFALTLQFETCTELLDWQQGVDDPEFGRFNEYIETYEETPGVETSGEEKYFCASPRQLITFGISQPGSETAFFGLSTFEDRAPDASNPGKIVATHLEGFVWKKFCKTQYASIAPEGDWENFFKIHDGICRVLDFAKTLGLIVEVVDEGEYYVKRDAAALKAEIARWNGMIAAFTGRLRDALGDRPNAVASAMGGSPEFERLEAEGEKIFGDKLDQFDFKIIRRPNND